MSKNAPTSLIYLGICAISAIVAVVLLVATPFLPDEVAPAVVAAISGWIGVKRLTA